MSKKENSNREIMTKRAKKFNTKKKIIFGIILMLIVAATFTGYKILSNHNVEFIDIDEEDEKYQSKEIEKPDGAVVTDYFNNPNDVSANVNLLTSSLFNYKELDLLDLYLNVVDGLVVYPKVIEARLMSELPFMATENIMMDAVKKGGDRQELHEKIRQHSMAAGAVVKVEGGQNDLVDRIANDPAFMTTKDEILAILKPENFVGRAPQQTADFLKETVQPILDANKELLGIDVTINV